MSTFHIRDMMPENCISPQAAAKEIGVSYGVMMTWLNQGIVPSVVYHTGSVQKYRAIDKKQFDAWKKGGFWRSQRARFKGQLRPRTSAEVMVYRLAVIAAKEKTRFIS